MNRITKMLMAILLAAIMLIGVCACANQWTDESDDHSSKDTVTPRRIQKSAAEDARNAFAIFVAEMSDGTGGVVVTDGTVIAVDKAGKTYAFTFEDNGLKTEYDDCVITDGEGTETASGSAYTKDDIDKLPENVRIYLA